MDHRVLHSAIRGHGDDDDAAFAMFDFLLQQSPNLANSINDIDMLLRPSGTRHQRAELDFGAPMHWAVLTGRRSRVEFLIDKGADVEVKTPRKGLTPADWARILEKEDLVTFFQDRLL